MISKRLCRARAWVNLLAGVWLVGSIVLAQSEVWPNERLNDLKADVAEIRQKQTSEGEKLGAFVAEMRQWRVEVEARQQQMEYLIYGGVGAILLRVLRDVMNIRGVYSPKSGGD